MLPPNDKEGEEGGGIRGVKGIKERDRERERQRQTDRQTKRQRDRQTDIRRQRRRQTDRLIYSQTEE